MHKIIQLFICFCLLVMSGTGLKAQQKTLNLNWNELGVPTIVNYSPDDYGSNPMNWGAVRDDRGILYVANLTGILEFDGVSWRKIVMPKGSWTLSIARDNAGIIYTGLFGDFGYLAPDSVGNLHFVSLLDYVDPVHRDFTEIWRIHSTKAGTYFRSKNKIFLWSDQKIKVIQTNSFFSLTSVLDDTLYVEERGVGLKKTGGDLLIDIPDSRRLNPLHFIKILPFDHAHKLVCTAKGLFLYDGHIFSEFKSPVNGFIKKNTLSSALALPDGRFIFSTYQGGACIIDREGRIIQVLNKNTGLRNEDIKNMYLDSEGNLWMSLNSGIARVAVQQPVSYFGEQQGLEGNVVSIRRHQNTIYAATSQAIFYLENNIQSGNVVTSEGEIHLPQFKQVKGITSQGFWLLSTGDGLLAATGGNGVYQIRGDRAYKINSIREGAFVLYQSPQDSTIVYVGLKNGVEVLKYRNNRWGSTGRIKGVAEEVRTIVENSDGTLWLGSVFQGVLKVNLKSQVSDGWEAEITRYNQANGLPDGPVNISKINGHVTFATQEGHRRFDNYRNTFSPDSTILPALADTSCSAAWIEQDQFGQIFVWPQDEEGKPEFWIIKPTQNGGSILEKEKFRSLSRFGIFHTTYTDQNGIIWIGCSTGLVRYDPTIIPGFDMSYPSTIRTVSSIPADSMIYRGFKSQETSPLILSSTDNSLRFEYSVPYFENISQITYQYMLEGYDQNWSNWTLETKKDYTNLGHGNYTFKVKAKNVYNHLSQEAIYSFVIEAPWYWSKWAYAGYLIFLIAGIMGVNRVMRSHLIRQELKKAELREAEIVNQKNKELQEKNDQLEDILSKLQVAQNSLIDSESRFRSVAESANDAIITADKTGTITFWNNRAEIIFGYSKNEAIGQPLTILMPERYRNSHIKGLERFFSSGEERIMGEVVDLEAVKKDGSEFPIELSLAHWETHDEKFVTGIVRDMTTRRQKEEALQNTQTQLFQSEKLSTLGKLSAGIAHELNNPASSTKRSSSQLQRIFLDLQMKNFEIGKLNFSTEQTKMLLELDQRVKKYSKTPLKIEAPLRSDREFDVEKWLEGQKVARVWEVAPQLVNLGYDPAELSDLAKIFPHPQFNAVINWLSATHMVYNLLFEISSGTDRIAAIVDAFKTFTYMDKAPFQKVDIEKDLDNTLILFQSKLKEKIKVKRDYDKKLPKIDAYGGELNQVWTNIINNAIDAMGDKGELMLRTRKEDSDVIVEIIDNGPGIPQKNKHKIFDPFFTTKKVGVGTGLGLNLSHNIIVQKHHGQISFSSVPGKTSFIIRLPLKGNSITNLDRGRNSQ